LPDGIFLLSGVGGMEPEGTLADTFVTSLNRKILPSPKQINLEAS
jgi:hypothetical protein